MEKRLENIDIDGMLTPASVEEYVTGSRRTAFPLLQYTERPDTFCQGLLNGQVGLLVDGLPLGYLAPVNLGVLMKSTEDRAVDYLSASCLRVLRYLALLAALLLPGLYGRHGDVPSGDDPDKAAAGDHRIQARGAVRYGFRGGGPACRV